MSWEDNVRRTVPYTPGEQPKISNIIKLNTNENPYPPSPSVAKVLSRMDAGELRKYPDPAAQRLTDALSAHFGVPADQIFVGVGSDDVLAMSFLTFFNSGKKIFFPDITYSFYDVWADVFRIPYETKPLDENFHIRPEDYFGENGGIVFPNPNAPTGDYLPAEEVENIIARNPESVVIVDEAYIDFGGRSVLPLIHQYENLLVVQTFSKSHSMAGMRIGYAFGSRKLIGYLNDVKYSFNSYTLNAPSILAGEAAIEDEDYFEDCCCRIVATRERTKKALRELGFVFADSKANFIFVRHPQLDAGQLFQDLRKANIIVRYFPKARIDQYLRITIGTDEQMQVLLDFLKDYVRKHV